MTNELIQNQLSTLRHNGLVVSLYRNEQRCVADGYDHHGELILSANAGTRKDALARLIDQARHRRPELLKETALSHAL